MNKIHYLPEKTAATLGNVAENTETSGVDFVNSIYIISL